MSWATRNAGAGRIGIAVLILFMYGMAMAALITVAIPDSNRDAFSLLLGGLNTALGGVVGYFFNITSRRQAGGS
ncbi:hypothetical protein P6166_04585 [Stenotrophomonas sp. HITSZ_GD]|uniref:Uncharacterized protein n=1 Tax=Stenotrophomonas panacihumi TaxID=676599 RepID=A0A0R0AZY3_9GAMM|nr:MULTISPECIES: hypothetical protein [Stenotrophomonas]KRG47358.1 hypothetical protein ARC20_03240 [Stenotrophomonas panacihumi]MDG2524634.1 hypothetical protein [Stenotrophomonas sp. HITSZ_GD]PTN55836.1 hypothetical protein C9J98_04480 [Stenotrophomonas panacihumi]